MWGKTASAVAAGQTSFDDITMTSLMAIAHINVNDGGNAVASATVTGGYSSATFNAKTYDGAALSGTSGSIAMTFATSADSYMALLPGTQTLKFSNGGKEANLPSKTVEANKFYNKDNAIAVNMLPAGALSGLFTVNSSGTKVRFSQGNLYCVWDGTSKSTPEWHFESNQYDFRTYSGLASCIDGSYNASGGTPTNNWGMFGWSTGSTTWGMSTSKNDSDYSGAFVDWGGNTIYACGTATTGWRTLTKDEWSYLIGESSQGRDTRLTKYSVVTFGSSGPIVSGLILMPDNWTGTLSEQTDYHTWLNLAADGAVFLPEAGHRNGTGVDDVRSLGFYWSSTPSDVRPGDACCLGFDSEMLFTDNEHSRHYGDCVRLVR